MARTVVDPVTGKNILEGGSPQFPDVATAGSTTPQNEVLDPVDITKSVAQLVLEKFDIPFSTPVLGGTLPGLDIKNQDPTTILKLSLSAELLDTPPPGSQRPASALAGFAEVELDSQGIARFYMAGQTPAVGLDIRYCVPTAQIVNPAQLVIVRGYDPPPRRELRDSFNGLKNAEIMNYSDCAEQSCEESTVAKYATISYDDPQLDQTYLDDVVNAYELEAFESLLGYIIDLDLPDGTNEEILGTKITFGDATKEYIKFPISLLNGATGTIEGEIGNGNVSQYFQATLTQGNEAVDPDCTKTVPLVGTKIVIPASRFKRLNKFGKEESDFNGVSEIVFAGRKVTSISYELTQTRVIVKPSVDLINLQHGKNWNYEQNAEDDIIIELFSPIEDSFSEFICDLYQSEFNIGPNSPGVIFSPSNSLLLADRIDASAEDLVCNIGDSLGYLTQGFLCVVVERKRPSIDIFDPDGNALMIAHQILAPSPLTLGPGNYEGYNNGYLTGLNYTPVVIIDEPAPIAYASTTPLSSLDGTRTLAAEGIIDQTDGIIDADPTTTQDIEDSELSILQDNTNGATIDMTLPFAYGIDPSTGRAGTECLEIARNFLILQSQIVESTSLVLGPDSTPRLGDLLPDGSVINEINWSYSDSSQYLITVTAGPLYITSGSFNDSRYQLQTEDVTREGTVIQDKGDGTTYVVRIEGFGEITALLMVLDDIAVGDKVQVRLYNNPVERL